VALTIGLAVVAGALIDCAGLATAVGSIVGCELLAQAPKPIASSTTQKTMRNRFMLIDPY
jgi:hypothetical protein